MARTLVAEAPGPVASALIRFLQSAGHEVLHAPTAEAAVASLGARGREPELVVAATVGFPGEALCARVKATAPACPVLLLYPESEPRPEERAQVAGADACVLLPPRRAWLLGLVRTCLQLGAARARADALELELKAARARSGQGAADTDFFKRFMVLEVKRSRRYQLPVAVLVAGLDGLDARADAQAPGVRAALRAEAMAALSALLRDVDVALPMAQDRYLVFLPHTPRDGALVVAGRVQAALSGLRALPNLAASVGVASYEPKLQPRAEVSFAALLQEAQATLALACAQGGARVSASTPPPRKRSRISLG